MARSSVDRNTNPHAEALMAMLLFSEEYANQRGGCMDFYEKLSESRKKVCQDWVARIKTVRRAP